MNTDQGEVDPHVSELVNASRKLATQVDLYGSVMDESFERAMSPLLAEVRAALEHFPDGAGLWDGEFRESDVRVSYFASPAPQGEKKRGVELRHIPTGISRQSYTKDTEEENGDVAMRSLQQAVHGRWIAMQSGS